MRKPVSKNMYIVSAALNVRKHKHVMCISNNSRLTISHINLNNLHISARHSNSVMDEKSSKINQCACLPAGSPLAGTC